MKGLCLTPVEEVVRYRLRRESRIVGWMREESSGQRFYSREGLWWSGRRIVWNQRDRCCGLQDIDNKWLHEGDVVNPVDGPWWVRRSKWMILCDAKTGWSAMRIAWNGRLRYLSEDAITQRRWRWAGFGWAPPR